MIDVFAHSTDEDDGLPFSIVHSRDTIVIDGQVDQDYRFLDYSFEGGVTARMYLDDPWEVTITAPIDGPVPEAVMAYLQRRFAIIRRPGDEGYQVVWAGAA